MAIRGGYQIINFKGVPFTSGEQSALDGVYNTVLSPYGKPTLVSGLVISDVAYPDFYAPFVAGGNNVATSVVIGGKTVTITIDNNDNVTATVTA